MDRTEHAEHTEGVLSAGTVREWSDDHGWGVIDSADTPGGCWVHFSMIVSEGFRSLRPGDHVTFTYEAPGQDGFNYRAALVWPPGVRPGTPQRPAQERPSAAYRSSLTIRWPDGSVTKGVPGRGQGEDPRPTVQLASLAAGTRTLTASRGTRHRRSAVVEARTVQIPKLIVRVRFPSPALTKGS